MPLEVSDFVVPAGRTADLLFLAAASADSDSSTGFYRSSERNGSDTPIAGDDKFGTGNDGKITRLRYRSGYQLSANQAGYSGGRFESYALNADLHIHIQTEEGVDSWPSTDHTDETSAGGKYCDWGEIPQLARVLMSGLSTGERFILAFTLPIVLAEDISATFTTRHGVGGSGSVAVTGADLAASFTVRHAIRGAATVTIRPQVDSSGTFTVRHALRGSGAIAIRSQVDSSGTFTVRHAVRGSGSLGVGVSDVSAAFTTRHDVGGSASIVIRRDDYVGGSGVAVHIGGFAYPGTDAEVNIQRPLDSRAQATFHIETTPKELAARHPQRGDERS